LRIFLRIEPKASTLIVSKILPGDANSHTLTVGNMCHPYLPPKVAPSPPDKEHAAMLPRNGIVVVELELPESIHPNIPS
jgi:hypothetical protein